MCPSEEPPVSFLRDGAKTAQQCVGNQQELGYVSVSACSRRSTAFRTFPINSKGGMLQGPSSVGRLLPWCLIEGVWTHAQEHSSAAKVNADGAASGIFVPAEAGSGEESGLIKAVSFRDAAPISSTVSRLPTSCKSFLPLQKADSALSDHCATAFVH